MPHAEYPSGSSCICTAFAETLQLLTGQDDIAFPLTETFEAGTSKTEEGVTPANDITIEYNKWSDIAIDCGESRLYGGMHFDEAIAEFSANSAPCKNASKYKRKHIEDNTQCPDNHNTNACSIGSLLR